MMPKKKHDQKAKWNGQDQTVESGPALLDAEFTWTTKSWLIHASTVFEGFRLLVCPFVWLKKGVAVTSKAIKNDNPIWPEKVFV